MHHLIRAILIISAVLATAMPAAHSARIKELVEIGGVRPNQLRGIGLITGLNGTGDTEQTLMANQALASQMAKYGIRLEAAVRTQNVAFVMVTAELPPFSRPGNRLDIKVSSVGDASSLEGGELMHAALRGHDGQVYVVAAGPVSVGGYSVTGPGGNSETRNHPTVGRVPRGGIVERGVSTDFVDQKKITLQLKRADFTTAARISKVINSEFGSAKVAKALDSGTVQVEIPGGYKHRAVEFMAIMERLEVSPDAKAKVVFNARTGTIVIGQEVRVRSVAVAHGNLTVTIKVDERAIPAGVATPGRTVKTRNAKLKVREQPGGLRVVAPGVTLNELVSSLNSLGASPRDLVSILQAIDQAGALDATLEIL
ncbi:MAG: flagellar basal body P-ring protein FlgI [Bradymonadia bacterium]